MNCNNVKAYFARKKVKIKEKAAELRDTVNFDGLRLNFTGGGGVRDVAAAVQRQQECENKERE